MAATATALSTRARPAMLHRESCPSGAMLQCVHCFLEGLRRRWEDSRRELGRQRVQGMAIET